MSVIVSIGNFAFRYRDALFPLALLLLLIPGPPIVPEPFVAVLIGTAVAALGQVVRGITIGFKYIIRGGRNRRVYAEDLVVEGIYAHTRNPMYVGNLMILVGVALASNNWSCVALVLPATACIYVSIVAAEEDFLRRKFGASFDAFCRDVPRWLPRLRGLAQTLGSMQFRWRRVIVKEYGTPFGWISVICLITAMHHYRSGGHLTLTDSTTRALAVAWFAALLGWLTARHLKKSGKLLAD